MVETLLFGQAQSPATGSTTRIRWMQTCSLFRTISWIFTGRNKYRMLGAMSTGLIIPSYIAG